MVPWMEERLDQWLVIGLDSGLGQHLVYYLVSLYWDEVLAGLSALTRDCWMV